MSRFAITANWAGATFVKTYDFFVSQGGLEQEWGKHWTIVEAEDIHAARILAIKLPGARAGLYCARCGHEDTKCVCEQGPLYT